MISRNEFDALVEEHQQLIDLANDLELHLYRLGETPDERVALCQQAAGALIGALRNTLFHHDQTVLPLLEEMSGSASSPAST